jgi:hypothetical protein
MKQTKFRALWLLALAAHASFAAGGRSPLQDIQTPTPAQLECRKNVPTRPTRVVFGFEGLAGFDDEGYKQLAAMNTPPPIAHQDQAPSHGALLWGMIAQGAMQIADTTWLYFPENAVSDKLSDAVRCLYEYAVHPYERPNGTKVYSTITLLGFSYGGHASYQVANMLAKLDVAVNLVTTADPRAKGLSFVQFHKPDTVGIWNNFFEKDDLFLAGQHVEGADHDTDLSDKGYKHQWMPGSDEVTASVRDELGRLSVCRSSPDSTTDLSPSLCQP